MMIWTWMHHWEHDEEEYVDADEGVGIEGDVDVTAFPHTKGLHTTTHLHPTSALSEVKLTSDEDDEETIEVVGTGEHVWHLLACTRLLTSTSPTMPELLPDLKLAPLY